ncbi:hypothetical protein SLS53_001499 [Cytospora paraplurivora]|uniref:Uncharacterized protein n=1 Tax=Cytospora paraplurivora TaxID=2898453 RepID=A0AAN9YKA0_9PEZI
MAAQVSATPSNRRNNQTNHSAGLVRVRPAGAMGKGLFALRDIARGTRIVDESPLFVVYDQPRHGDMSEEAFERDVSVFCETAQELSAEKLHKLDQLHYDASYDTADDKDRVMDWYHAQGVTDEKGLKTTAPEWVRMKREKTVDSGEQIFVQYFDSPCLPRDQRQNKAKGFGFICYIEKDPFGPAYVPNSPDQALRDVEELIGLLKHPSINLRNSTLRNAYRAGFKITLENGDVQKATEYAQRDLELTIYMVGTDDTDYLHGDDKDGQLGYWFRQLENMGDM